MRKALEVRRVLIVDDEPEIREALKRIMKLFNLESETSENGKVALEMLKEKRFQAVLCDIMMPEMTGLQCLAYAQTLDISTPFIFVTGFGDKDKMLQATRLGAVDFILKPFDIEEIADVTFRVLEIGARQERIKSEIRDQNPSLFSDIQRDEHMISLLRVTNNKKRAG